MSPSFAPSHKVDNDHEVSGRIYSVGYEGLEVENLVEILRSAHVTQLVDVRLTPTSRRRGWSKKALQAALESANIAYRHEPDLGNPPENRDSFRRGDGEEGRQRMRSMLTNGSRPALQRLVEDAREGRIAVLCVERAARNCHREVITDMAREIHPEIDVLPVL